MAVGDNVKFKMGTQAQYESATLDENALYFTTDSKNLYKGSTLYNGNTRAYTIVIGNKPAGDTEKDCDYLYQEEMASSFYATLNTEIRTATSPITLFFRRGTYNIYDTIYVGSGKNVTIIGENRDGTILNEYYNSGSTHTSRNLIQVGGYDSYDGSIYTGIMCIKDITLKTSNDASYNKGYAIQCCGTLTVDHCTITGLSKNTHGIYTEGHLTVKDSTISACNYGIMARNCADYSIEGNTITNCSYSIVTGKGDDSYLPGGTDYQGNYVDGTGFSIQSEGCFGHICNNYIESAVSMGIYVGARSVVSGNVIYNPSVTGIDISSRYCNISDNIVKSGYGFIPKYIYRLTGNFCNFSNNIYFRQDGTSFPFSGVYPLYCTASKCNITGNSLLFAYYGGSSYTSGVYFDNSAQSNIVTSNRMVLMNDLHSSNIQANNSSSI